MNCLFCQQDLILYRTVNGEKRYDCTPCHASFFYDTEEKGLLCHYFDHGKYRAIFWENGVHYGGETLENQRAFYLFEFPDTSVMIIHLDFFPPLTPQNIAGKLPTLLVWS